MLTEFYHLHHVLLFFFTGTLPAVKLGLPGHYKFQEALVHLTRVTSRRRGGACIFSQPIFYLQPLFIYFILSPLSPCESGVRGHLRDVINAGGEGASRGRATVSQHRTESRTSPQPRATQ